MTETHSESSHFIRDLIQKDLDDGRHVRVITRFPPEPNGYLHIGHSKAICLNFGLAQEFAADGFPTRCHLRFDDTNPVTEDPEFVESIQRDIRWLGFDWGQHLYYASDYFETMYELAEVLIRRGKAYVDDAPEATVREYRGTITEPGRPTPARSRGVEENLDLFRRMRAGEFEDGACVLRGKIDLAATNMLLRDPILYRIRHAHHYRQGDDWCIYPMYDYAHCLEDAIEGVTHSFCTLEFDNNRALYDWVIEETRVEPPFEGQPVPRQTEFARLNLGYTVMSKRKLKLLVEEGHVAGWDDPRMPTLSAYRRRGYTPESIRAFSERVGIAKTYNMIDPALLEFSIRDDLNTRAPRVMAVLDPIKLIVENYPEGQIEELEASYWPHDVPKEGVRKVPFGRELWIERDDFSEDPPEGWHRLAPGREVRLRYAYLVTLTEVVRDADDQVVELRATYDPATRGGDAPDSRKVRGTLHWVAAEQAVDAKVRLYDRLFRVERPGEGGTDFRSDLNPESLVVLRAKLERSLGTAAAGDHFQFERQGYFFVDPADSKPDRPVFNRTVTLRDTWAKQTGGDEVQRIAERRAAEREKRKREQRALSAESTAPDLSPNEADAAARLEAGGVAASDARVIVRRPALFDLFDATVAAGSPNDAAARWIVHEVAAYLDGEDTSALRFGPTELAQLVELVDAGTITGSAGKEVLAVLAEQGGSPREIVDARGLEKLDADTLGPIIDRTLAEHAEKVAAYRAGKTALLGFFMGQVMRETSGAADASEVRSRLVRALAEPA